jgi:hypothetical protein
MELMVFGITPVNPTRFGANGNGHGRLNGHGKYVAGGLVASTLVSAAAVVLYPVVKPFVQQGVNRMHLLKDTWEEAGRRREHRKYMKSHPELLIGG